jgi:hypothetical protein
MGLWLALFVALPVAGTAGLMCEGHNHQLVVSHEVDDPIGEYVNLPAPYYGQPIPAGKRRPRVGVPQYVVDGACDFRIELVAKSSLS